MSEFDIRVVYFVLGGMTVVVVCLFLLSVWYEVQDERRRMGSNIRHLTGADAKT